jgi:hypothetical protein
MVDVHIISAAGGISQVLLAAGAAGITVRLKCTNLMGLSAAWRVKEWDSHELAKIIKPGLGVK